MLIKVKNKLEEQIKNKRVRKSEKKHDARLAVKKARNLAGAA